MGHYCGDIDLGNWANIFVGVKVETICMMSIFHSFCDVCETRLFGSDLVSITRKRVFLLKKMETGTNENAW